MRFALHHHRRPHFPRCSLDLPQDMATTSSSVHQSLQMILPKQPSCFSVSGKPETNVEKLAINLHEQTYSKKSVPSPLLNTLSSVLS